jgi:hypothetical protein
VPRKPSKGLGPSVRLPPQLMPCCGRLHDAGAQIGGEGRPTPGAWSLCIGCGNIGIYRDDLKVRLATRDELTTALADPTVREALRAWTSMVVAIGAPPEADGGRA